MQDASLEVRDELQEETKVIDTPASDPFSEGSWVENIPQQEPVKEQVQEQKIETVVEEKKEEQAISEWYKDLGFETADEAKNEVVELRKLKDTKPQEQEFANEDSKKLFESLKAGDEEVVFNLLDKKRQVDKLLKVEINETTAADIVKLAMQQKYKDFTPEEINYKFNKQFGIPKEPEQRLSELDEDFEIRKAEWEEKVKDAKQDLIIEAKLAKPELEKLKTELVLPNIQKETNQNDQLQSEEELAEIENRREKYLESLGNDFKNFNGFEATYKNEDVEIPVAYTISDEEKTSLKGELESFDVEGFILNRWFKEDGAPNVKGLMEDIYLLRNKEKVFQKIATDTGNKVLENKVKTAKNINVTGGQGTFVPQGDKSEQEKMAAFFFSQ